MNIHELRRRFPNATEAFLRANADADGVAPGPISKSGGDDEHVGQDAGKVAYQGRCLVSLTSFRRVLCDERNLYDKHFVDALKEAGAFIDDSPQFVKVEVAQVKVAFPHEERTVITISPLV